jgi:uncharacterized protein (DUF2062 family)
VRKRIRDAFHNAVHAGGSPEKIAFAFALGVFIGFFPILGTHTALAFGMAWVFRVNPMVTFGGSFVNNPWTIAPIFFGSYYLGIFLVGGDRKEINVQFSKLNWHTIMELIRVMGVPYVVGGLVSGVVASVVTYFIMLRMVKIYRSRQAAPPAP